jgi:hypothetical protein
VEYDLKLSPRVTDFRHICYLGPDQTLKSKAPALPIWQIKTHIKIIRRFTDFINACAALRELPYASRSQFCAVSLNLAFATSPPFSAFQT